MDKYFFEIADSLFGRDILIVNRVVKAPVDAQKRKVGYPGDYISDEVIRFEKGRGDKLFVREISYLEHSADTLGMYQAVLNSNCSTIVGHLPLKTVRKEGETTNYVSDMTDYIRKDNEMFSFTSRVKDNIRSEQHGRRRQLYRHTESLSAKHRNTYRAYLPAEERRRQWT